MRKRLLAILLVLPVLAGGVCGCDDSVAQGPLRGATIEVVAGWSGGEQESFTKVYEIFERETGADVRYVSGGDDISILLQTRLQGDSPPNVAIVPQPGLIQHLASIGKLTELPTSVADQVRNSYHPFWQQLGSVDGQLYAVYFKATNKSSVWYSAPLLAESGVEPPETWDEFLGACAKLSDFGITPVSIGGADGWVLTDWFENVYLQMAGAQKYDELSQHRIPWTDPSVRQALEKLAQLFGLDRYLDGGRTGALQTEFEDSVVNVFGQEPTAAMVYEGDFVAGVIKNDTDAQVGQTAKFFEFPRIGNDPAGVVVGGDAAVALINDRATMEFMKFLASPRAGMEWTKRGGFLSPNREVPLDSYPDQPTKELAKQIISAGENIRYDMSDMYPAQFGATKGVGEWKSMQDFLNSPQDAEAVMKQLEAEAVKALK
jgi:alpha-glucoside transport system substrate-binding protein